MRTWMMCLLIAIAAVGCSTPRSRIEKHPELFNRLPPEAQENVRQGRIDIGYSQDAVMLALGDPARTYSRRTADGETVVWSYVDQHFYTERQRADVDVPVYDLDGRRRTRREWVWVDVQKTEEFEKLRVELKNGVVTAIETLAR